MDGSHLEAENVEGRDRNAEKREEDQLESLETDQYYQACVKKINYHQGCVVAKLVISKLCGGS